MNLKSILKICFLILILCSCNAKPEINDCDQYGLGAFYPNNQLNSKDSTNPFQQNCHFLFLLQFDSIEVYNRNSEDPLKLEQTSKFRLSEFDCKRFKTIVNKTSTIKETPINHNKIYCGLSYVVSVGTCQRNKHFNTNHGLNENDEKFISKMFEKSKHHRPINPSNRIIKEKYFMTAMLHEKNYVKEITDRFKD